MLGFSPVGSAPLGSSGEYSDDVPVTAMIGWTEVSDGLAMGVSVSMPESAVAAIGWTDVPESHQAAVTVGLPATAFTAGWVEVAESVSMIISLTSPEYARGPSGPGFQPRRCGGQNRPPAFQGRCR